MNDLFEALRGAKEAMEARELSAAAQRQAEETALYEAAERAGREAAEPWLKQMDPEAALEELKAAGKVVRLGREASVYNLTYAGSERDKWKTRHAKLVDATFEAYGKASAAFLEALLTRLAEIHDEFESTLNPAEAA